ncbi:MAG: adenylate/guanylate cyclase domain-containing protein [Ilumatobacteraceae bacterium]
MSVQPPSGTVTFLFTDIQDSTQLWESGPAEMAAAFPVHDAIVRAAIERHDGYVFATSGDGFCAAFSTAANAVAAAVESQRELGGAAVVPFKVRMGLHTGETIERDRTYVGPEVNRAARLMTLGNGGQVLVSDSTEVLVRGRVALRSLGDHVLPGLRGKVAVFQVVAEGLAAEFPMLRSVDDFAGKVNTMCA